MKSILAAIVLLFASAAVHADSVITVTATNIVLNNATLNMSFDYDVTTDELVPGTTSINFLGSNLGSQFSFFAGFDGGHFIDFTDAEGDFLQFDPSNEEGENANLFPQIGSYPAWIVDTDCNASLQIDECRAVTGDNFSNGLSGTLVVTDPPAATTPEPGGLALLALGLVGLFTLKLKAA